MNKIYYQITLLLLFCAVLSLPLDLFPQTVRVSAGRSADGCKSYIEVYEYDFVSEKPAFPGGDSRLLEYINSERHYPDEAYKAGIQGRVTCSFIINTDGSVSNVTLLKSVEESLNREAVRIFRIMPSWIPGSHNGMPVPVRVIRSIPFRK